MSEISLRIASSFVREPGLLEQPIFAHARAVTQTETRARRRIAARRWRSSGPRRTCPLAVALPTRARSHPTAHSHTKSKSRKLLWESRAAVKLYRHRKVRMPPAGDSNATDASVRMTLARIRVATWSRLRTLRGEGVRLLQRIAHRAIVVAGGRRRNTEWLCACWPVRSASCWPASCHHTRGSELASLLTETALSATSHRTRRW